MASKLAMTTMIVPSTTAQVPGLDRLFSTSALCRHLAKKFGDVKINEVGMMEDD